MPLKRFRCKECDKVFIAAIEPYEVGRVVVTCPGCGSAKLWEEKGGVESKAPSPKKKERLGKSGTRVKAGSEIIGKTKKDET